MIFRILELLMRPHLKNNYIPFCCKMLQITNTYCCVQLWEWHMICGQTCDGLYHFAFCLIISLVIRLSGVSAAPKKGGVRPRSGGKSPKNTEKWGDLTKKGGVDRPPRPPYSDGPDYTQKSTISTLAVKLSVSAIIYPRWTATMCVTGYCACISDSCM